MLSGFYILHKKNPNGSESVPLQTQACFKTCLRTIHFLWLQESEQLIANNEFEVFEGTKAYQFLLEVICGLQSPVLGETEVFGQFKTFLQNANVEYPLSTLLANAIVDTKKIRAQFIKDLGGQSYGSLVRKMLRKPAQVHLIGAGAFVQDLLPWIYKDENQVRILSRDIKKAEAKFAKAFPRVNFESLSNASISSGVVIVAAPLSAAEIEKLIATPDVTVIDLRGESREDECQKFKNYHNLSKFFAVIEQNQQKMVHVKTVALAAIDEISQQRMMVESFRPFGWDDICVW